MTVVNTTNRWSYPADGTTTTFPYDNRIFEASDLEVYLGDVLQTSGYTVSGVDEPTGGNVVFAAAPPAPGPVLLYRNVPATQKTKWPARDPFPSAAQERAADKSVVLIQQMQEVLARTVKRPTTSTSTASLDLPDPIAGRALKFGSDGVLGLSDGDPDAAQSDAAAQVALAAAQASAASAARVAAESARDTTLDALDHFDDRYLGAKTADPTTDNDGDPLVGGALYFNEVDGVMKLYTGSVWVAAYVSGIGYLQASNALAEIAALSLEDAACDNIGAAKAADLSALEDYVDASVGDSSLHVRDSKASGTAGGTFTSGAYQTRTLNTTVVNTISGASLASNQITLPAGTYDVWAIAPGYYCGRSKIRLYNVTNSAAIIVGSVVESTPAGSYGATGVSTIRTVFTLSVESVIELQHRCTNTRSTDGFGLASSIGDEEIYAEVFLKKVG